ncbi:bifunctional phosphopantothenoylcysteine decarboxylase/phosphopantothenate--cysteine ligase CoaBC [Acidithiobacillus ferriphilus]|jgi:phosphopantothenoylcysteine decarboxylase/phosphopantothenate--cysteine ligase|uniref:bifunctional phosphopantothenoylcysteine decarboxylase/phosphopantothenate--cysteine ligase CoaBC n=1 Tax=Acidithiobacillus ferriphilus TaxID=1689834 RepID=UPI001C075914|nr:bifunctional phosphopantothenoylcysteine decarboxylase/phosphopantothenate--cysteine ligase CoaBC [Acidithiobacillus ferriphilus]MBU2832299.1 bifunctional phosphopantothenoylcysteine decarboxylase/phosphopantothenate--cysteine ligase CoaBC [Acidithiobacillus ferriphilus]MBW9249458.1 bifunctional phosphopantothenoylcysteine decarboxylase/phosphopantothenate--cysteine ligase CoaBC [Acidithiobacillus ferriphilus]MBW9254647.1 bifunctional phosphopantothenoylcysteine decarboxylase/phosphopantothen
MTGSVFNTTEPLAGKRILLGVGGSVAAYKSPEIVRALRQAGVELRVVMTRGAAQFVTPLTLQAVSGEPVRSDLFAAAEEAAMDHIRLARWADALLIAPISANGMARLAQGLADDLLSTIVLANRAPLFLAPAMNSAMWAHPATQRNVAQLRADGAHFLGPDSGSLACGEEGTGRLLAPERLVDELRLALTKKTLCGQRVLITAGPTWEAIDPARGFSNRASGRQGFALAQACAEAGANVLLITGPTHEQTPPGVSRQDVLSAQDMLAACLQALDKPTDIFIANAAVADHRPSQFSAHKLGKTDIANPLPLSINPDIVSALHQDPRRPRWIVAFAAETRDHLAAASAKAARKGADVIVVNDITSVDVGMGATDNACSILQGEQVLHIPRCSKMDLARHLVRHLSSIFSLPATESEDLHE